MNYKEEKFEVNHRFIEKMRKQMNQQFERATQKHKKKVKLL